VSFKRVADYTTPDDLVVNIKNAQTATATGAYKRHGSLTVDILPAEAVDGGAKWSVDGGTTWRASGVELLGVPAGEHVVSFNVDVTDYSPPADKTVIIAPGRPTTLIGRYTFGYVVLAKPTTGGTVTPARKVIFDGSPVTFKVKPKTGYTMSPPPFSGTCAKGLWDPEAGTYTTGAVTEACFVSFTFTKEPTVVTGKATRITQAEATLNGRVNPENDMATVTFEYEDDTTYTATSAYSKTVSAGVLEGGDPQAVAAQATGLACETKYHFRVVAVNSNGRDNGADRVFWTVCQPPVATTLKARDITQIEATLRGGVNPKKAPTTVTFEYEDDTTYTVTSAYSKTVSGGRLTGVASRVISATVSELTCDTKYHFRVVAVNFVGTKDGADLTFTTSACADSSRTMPPVSDFNGDGKSDILLRDAVTGQTAVWMMNGASVTSSLATSMNAGAYTSTSGWQTQGIGDFDGDGKYDLLWRDSATGELAVWTMNGATVVTSGMASVNPGAYTSTTGWQVQGIGDFNGDGKSDILWRDAQTGQTGIWLMNGAVKIGGRRASSNAGAYTSTTGWQVQGVGDFNGDGKADILWRHAGTGKTSIWFMNGATKIGGGYTNVQAGEYTSTTGWQVQGAGDFNGDGKSDILLRDSATGRMAIWTMNGVKVVSTAYTSVDAGPYTSSTGLQVSAIADYNGDGKYDILLRDVETGQTRVWIMNGSQVTSDTATDLNPGVYTSSTGWSVVSEKAVR
jgi:hypothetical protein